MQDDLILQAYDYNLPEENIAQHPVENRDQSRLMVLDHRSGTINHSQFTDIKEYINSGDVLVINNTRVFPARLNGKKSTGGKAEVFLLGYPTPLPGSRTEPHRAEFSCEALIKSSRKPKPGSAIIINNNCECTVLENSGRGKWSVSLSIPSHTSLENILAASGDVPLPPYINRISGGSAEDMLRYQTVYADQMGAVAAPTAGLHFTTPLLNELHGKGVHIAPITLHVGYGTFSPVETENITDHDIHHEHMEISPESAECINRTKKNGGKVWAVGTTSVRALEFSVNADGQVQPFTGWCDLYITPGFNYQVVDNMVTNFHLPRSSLMFLVAALCGRKRLLHSYQLAINKGYRFYSYGDAMAIISGDIKDTSPVQIQK